MSPFAGQKSESHASLSTLFIKYSRYFYSGTFKALCEYNFKVCFKGLFVAHDEVLGSLLLVIMIRGISLRDVARTGIPRKTQATEATVVGLPWTLPSISPVAVLVSTVPGHLDRRKFGPTSTLFKIERQI
jgi:hypothetical protein